VGKIRKISRKGLIKKLDKLVSEIVIARDKACVVCGSKEKLGCGHVFSRKHLATRFDVTSDGNCHCQCWPCNFKHTFDTYPYNNWYVKKFGKKKFQQLYDRWNIVCPMKTWQIQSLFDELKGGE